MLPITNNVPRLHCSSESAVSGFGRGPPLPLQPLRLRLSLRPWACGSKPRCVQPLAPQPQPPAPVATQVVARLRLHPRGLPSPAHARVIPSGSSSALPPAHPAEFELPLPESPSWSALRRYCARGSAPKQSRRNHNGRCLCDSRYWCLLGGSSGSAFVNLSGWGRAALPLSRPLEPRAARICAHRLIGCEQGPRQLAQPGTSAYGPV